MDQIFIKLNEWTNNFISNEQIKKYKKHTKKTKIDLKYIFLYRLFTTFLSKEAASEAVNKILINSNLSAYDRTSFYRQEVQISLDFYKMLHTELFKMYDTLKPKSSPHKYEFVAIDGTHTNGIGYDNVVHMGYYDVTNKIPLDLNTNGMGKKNKEISELTTKIKNEPDFFKNKVLIADRAYFSYDLMYLLIRHNISFIIRSKSDCSTLKAGKIKKDTRITQLLQKTTRVISDTNGLTTTIVCSNKSKKGNKKIKFTVQIKNDYHLITNLSKHFDNEFIKTMYAKRWEIETYFKLIKNNFEFEDTSKKSIIELQKTNLCISMLSLICKIFSNQICKEGTIDTNLDDENIVKCNESKLMRFLQNTFMTNIICNKHMTYEQHMKLIKPNIKIRKYQKGRSYPRKSKTPHTKWYVKEYSNQSALVKILWAKETDTVHKLNKNLKLTAKDIIILKKKYLE